METKKQTVEQIYKNEIEEIEEQIELYKNGEIYDFQLLNRIKILAIRAYYDGEKKGINETQKIYKS